ncbi:hypothetical protein [Pseudoduganella chitinolytica]|uniref:Secreted protein n=1 Tax=Pseudoduganella chitinolytica TaxID=34070 RepID=A0ABY8BGB2_9BURK|nr:hypothetical protein [Pseudoduganella chitinolytica]WEF33757.1 hypothetical protein PX653_02905 [Pseudoduganella chitinolytica]
MKLTAARIRYATAGCLALALLAAAWPGALPAHAARLPAAAPPIEMPPDPGEAGRATLAGIDSNDNGVRDDLERHIARHFGTDERVRRAVANAVIATQQGILATDADDSAAAQAMLVRAGDCMGAIATDLAPYGDALWRLRPLIDDTPERKEAMAAHMRRVLRMDSAVREELRWDERCAARIDEVEEWRH